MAEKEKIPVVAQLNEMTVLVREALDDANKFDAGLRGSNAAGARVRKQMQFVRSLARHSTERSGSKTRKNKIMKRGGARKCDGVV